MSPEPRAVPRPGAGAPGDGAGAPVWRESAGPAGAAPIVLVHGSMDRSTGLLKVSRQLDATHRVVRYDRRGYGRSVGADGRHRGPFGIDHQVADLLDVLDRAGVTGAPDAAAVLVGHSYGGNVALALAERHPHLVRAVAVYETPLSWEPWWPRSTAGAAAVAAVDEPEVAAERFMRRLIGDARWEALPERTRATRRAEGAAMVGELADLRIRAPWSAHGIRVPVVAAYGEHGAAHHRRGMEHLAEVLADAEVVELAGCRHDAPLSHPALFAERVVGRLLDRAGRT